MATRICMKVEHLRKLGYQSLEDWMSHEDNIYVGRHGRIFITENDEKRIFHYGASIFANPFKVDKKGKDGKIIKLDGTVEECVKKYEKYLVSKPELIDKLGELKGKNLGCFCPPDSVCHTDVLIKQINIQ